MTKDKKATAKVKEETPSLSFDHDGKSYEFVVRQFKIEDKVITAEEAVKNESLRIHLVAIQAGVIKLIS